MNLRDSNSATTKMVMRTCVGCRQTDLQGALLRVSKRAEAITFDKKRRSAGRGAYLHAKLSCLSRAERGGFSRSFRMSFQTPIAREAVTAVREHILSLPTTTRLPSENCTV